MNLILRIKFFIYRNWYRLFLQIINRVYIKKDKEVCGISLNDIIDSPYYESHGAYRSESVGWWMLEIVFQGINYSENIKILDVGSGLGRILAFFVKRNFTGHVTGIEINKNIYVICKKWSSIYPNISVINDDVFNVHLKNYDVIVLFNPMNPERTKNFIQKIELEVEKSIYVYHISDNDMLDYMDKRKNWEIIKRGWIYTYKGIPIVYFPQRYSIYKYNCQ